MAKADQVQDGGPEVEQANEQRVQHGGTAGQEAGHPGTAQGAGEVGRQHEQEHTHRGVVDQGLHYRTVVRARTRRQRIDQGAEHLHDGDEHETGEEAGEHGQDAAKQGKHRRDSV